MSEFRFPPLKLTQGVETTHHHSSRGRERKVVDAFDGRAASAQKSCGCRSLTANSNHSPRQGNNVGSLTAKPQPVRDCYCFECKGNSCPWYKQPCGLRCYPNNWIAGKCPDGWKLCPGEDGNWKCCGP